MSTLLIAECRQQGRDGLGATVPVLQMPTLAEQAITFAATSVQSALLNADTRLVRLTSDADCRIAFGVDPTALVTGAVKLFANQPDHFNVPPGYKIAVIAG